jgi:hypothetical protein
MQLPTSSQETGARQWICGPRQPALTDFDGYFRASTLITRQNASKSRANKRQSGTKNSNVFDSMDKIRD